MSGEEGTGWRKRQGRRCAGGAWTLSWGGGLRGSCEVQVEGCCRGDRAGGTPGGLALRGPGGQSWASPFSGPQSRSWSELRGLWLPVLCRKLVSLGPLRPSSVSHLGCCDTGPSGRSASPGSPRLFIHSVGRQASPAAVCRALRRPGLSGRSREQNRAPSDRSVPGRLSGEAAVTALRASPGELLGPLG